MTTKSQLYAQVAEASGKKGTTTKAVLDTLFGTIAKSLAAREKVVINGFGTFDTIDRQARVGRNPATGEEFAIPAQRAIKFKPAPALKGLL